jgi:hypothetical protein
VSACTEAVLVQEGGYGYYYLGKEFLVSFLSFSYHSDLTPLASPRLREISLLIPTV